MPKLPCTYTGTSRYYINLRNINKNVNFKLQFITYALSIQFQKLIIQMIITECGISRFITSYLILCVRYICNNIHF